VLKELGEHPAEGGRVQVLSGRYGPYVKHGSVNATLPRGREPADLTMEEAVQLIAERAAKGPANKARRASASKPKADAKRSTKPKAPEAKAKSKPRAKGRTAGTREAAE
jgi:DNA topoisomerase-1